MTPTGLRESGGRPSKQPEKSTKKRQEVFTVWQTEKQPAVCSRIFMLEKQVANHMSVAVETGVWLMISGATYSGVPYLQ